jgi:hypothetical protein
VAAQAGLEVASRKSIGAATNPVKSLPLWTGRSLLSRILAAVFGALLGAALTFSIVSWTGVSAWPLYLPIPMAALAGFWKGDHALFVLLRALRW